MKSNEDLNVSEGEKTVAPPTTANQNARSLLAVAMFPITA